MTRIKWLTKLSAARLARRAAVDSTSKYDKDAQQRQASLVSRLKPLLLAWALTTPLTSWADTPAWRIHTENYARPPYSGAVYYFYHAGPKIVCTKLSVCNKYDQCEVEYRQGEYREDGDDEPFNRTDAVPIPPAKLKAHKCLVKFGLVK